MDPTENFDDFFEQSPLFEENRIREKKELEIFNKNEIVLPDKSLRCKRCNNANIELRRIIRSEDDAPVVPYCLNCEKIINN